jgi:nitrate/nitrite transporter NarK
LAVGSASLALAAICVAAVALMDDRRAVVIFLTFGFGVMDLMLPAAWAICLDIGGAHAGALSGAMNTAGSAGGFLCATLFGAVVNATGDYNLPVLCIAGMLAISALLFTRLDPERSIV